MLRQNLVSCQGRILWHAKAEPCFLPRPYLTRDFQARSRNIFGQCFGYDLALDERSQAISGISLHIISPRIFLDGSGSKMGPWHGQFLLPSSGNGRQVGRVGHRSKKGEIKVLRMSLPIPGNVPTSARSVLHTFPASHGPYSEKYEFRKTKRGIQQNNKNITSLFTGYLFCRRPLQHRMT